MISRMSTNSENQIEIVSINNIDLDDNFSTNDAGYHQSTNNNKSIDNKSASLSFIEIFFESSLNTIPLFMKYFALHETIVLMCGGIYYLQPDLGVLCLSIIPGLCIISIFIHFLLTEFDRKNFNIQSTFFSIKHYSVALTIFTVGLFSIIAIYHINTYLSYLIPTASKTISNSSIHSFIKQILQFPNRHSVKEYDETQLQQHPFNYRVTFVGSIIAPVIEESSKFFLLSLTFPISFIWQFSHSKYSSNSTNSSSDNSPNLNYLNYCIQSLFVMLVGLCGGCGIATMENIGYLAACQWDKTEEYCLPNRNFNILGAGLARGIFSVPFHCVTSIIMADIVCMWMNTNIKIFHKNKVLYIIKFILSYPISIIFPIFLHSGFNFWMKDIPFMTGFVTITGFAFVCSRISKKHSTIIGIKKKKIDSKKEQQITYNMHSIDDMTDLTIIDNEIESNFFAVL